MLCSYPKGVKLLRCVATFSIGLSLLVVMLGAYTRLTNAGLGCPDWPGCYGRMAVSSLQGELPNAQARFPDAPIETRKAWTEMVHRYAAGSLVLLIVIMNGFGCFVSGLPRRIPLVLLFLITFQALLGMWTVTLKLLPLVVMGHLLGGLLIFSSLCYYRAQLSLLKRVDNQKWRVWITLGLFLIFCQIALGGWVSSNYAGVACIGFPTCNGRWLPNLDFLHAFNLFLPVGANYQGGVLDSAARVTIQFVHRLGAFAVGAYVLMLSGWLWFRVYFIPLRIAAVIATVLVLLQVGLGIMNVVYQLPLQIAVLHNGVAALLLALLFVMRYVVSGGARNEKCF
jgi:cytochrome c oxidase assembly protein subunit 15